MPNTTAEKDYTQYSEKQLFNFFKFYQDQTKKSVRKIERNPNSKTKNQKSTPI
ncbi:hypothetical protein HpBT0154_12610 [Helicobacter pylori]